jgi:hypothetical protein
MKQTFEPRPLELSTRKARSHFLQRERAEHCMRPLTILLCACIACLCSSFARAADPWRGALVLPKSAHVRLTDVVAGRDTGSVLQIEWPAAVEMIDGQWIFVRDSGGYSVPPAAGWVRKADMLRIEEAVSADQDPRTFYTEMLDRISTASDAAVLHWLRGAYHESQGETSAALLDYCAAAGPALPGECQKVCRALAQPDAPRAASVALDDTASFAAADACLRLGRLIAQKQSDGDSDETWKSAFRAAESGFKSAGQVLVPNGEPPELPFAWGSAALERYKAALNVIEMLKNDNPSAPAQEKPKDHDPAADYRQRAKCYRQLAQRKFVVAIKANALWYEPFFNLGEVYLTYGQERLRLKGKTGPYQNPASQMPSNEELSPEQAFSLAVGAFDRAIQLDPRRVDAYRDRAMAFLHQATDQETSETLQPRSKSPPTPSPPVKKRRPPPLGNINVQPPAEPRTQVSDPQAQHSTAAQRASHQSPVAATGPASPTVEGPQYATLDEALRHAKKESLLRKAYSSANAACRLDYFQDSTSLTTSAQILAEIAVEMAVQRHVAEAKAYYEQASDFALQAAVLPDSASDRDRLQSFSDACLACKNKPTPCISAPQLQVRLVSAPLLAAPRIRPRPRFPITD